MLCPESEAGVYGLDSIQAGATKERRARRRIIKLFGVPAIKGGQELIWVIALFLEPFTRDQVADIVMLALEHVVDQALGVIAASIEASSSTEVALNRLAKPMDHIGQASLQVVLVLCARSRLLRELTGLRVDQSRGSLVGGLLFGQPGPGALGARSER